MVQYKGDNQTGKVSVVGQRKSLPMFQPKLEAS